MPYTIWRTSYEEYIRQNIELKDRELAEGLNSKFGLSLTKSAVQRYRRVVMKIYKDKATHQLV